MHTQSPINYTCSPPTMMTNVKRLLQLHKTCRLLSSELQYIYIYQQSSGENSSKWHGKFTFSSLFYPFFEGCINEAAAKIKKPEPSHFILALTSSWPATLLICWEIRELMPWPTKVMIQPAKINAIWLVKKAKWRSHPSKYNTQKRRLETPDVWALRWPSFLEVNEGLGIFKLTWSVYSNQSGKTPK